MSYLMERGRMKLSNSPLVSYTQLSPNNSGLRVYDIDRISPHCTVGQCSVEALGNVFAPTSREASSNYGIGCDARVGMYVEEKNRSWCTSSYDNDNRAVTIECASDTYAPYAFKDCVYEKLIELCADICKRNGKNKLIWISDKDTALSYKVQPGEMLLTVHRWFANKSCPGDWLMERMDDLANRVTVILNPEPEPAPDPTPKNIPTKQPWEYDITYRTHTAEYGWFDYVGDGEESGTKGLSLPIDAMQVEGGLNSGILAVYQAYIDINGETGVCKMGEVCGAEDKGRDIYAIKVTCEKPIEYRVYRRKKGWTKWAKNNEWTEGKEDMLRVECIQIRLAKK